MIMSVVLKLLGIEQKWKVKLKSEKMKLDTMGQPELRQGLYIRIASRPMTDLSI